MTIVLSLLACTGDPPDPDQRPLSVVDSTLDAIVGEPYTGRIEVTGGSPPYQLELTGGSLPEGMVFNAAAGAISGVADEAAVAELSVLITDEDGSTAVADLSLTVSWDRDMLPCADSTAGEFTEVAVKSGGDDVNWDADGGLTYLRIPLPPDDIHRIKVTIDAGPDTYAFLGAPGVLPGHTDLGDFRRRNVSDGGTVTVDEVTAWDLETYRAVGEPITLLLVGSSGDWSATSDCTDGPIIQRLSFYPTELGEFVYVNYNVEGDQSGVTFSIDGDLPAWVTFDPSNGKLSGIAEEAGLWEYAITATDAEGRSRTEQSAFGVFAVEALPCGTQATTQVEDGYYNGRFNAYYDPRGFRVFRTPLSEEDGTVTITAEGIREGGLSLVSPGSAYRFYGSAQSRSTWDQEPLSLSVSPQSYPVLETHRLQDAALYTILVSYYDTTAEMTVSVDCDSRPQLDAGGLPVLSSGAESLALEATGGLAPYDFAAEGLPEGVTLSADGTLTHGGMSDGSWPVSLEITDSAQQVRVADWTLYAGEDACNGSPRLSCGDTVTASLTGSWWSDPVGGARDYCVLFDHDDAHQLIMTLDAVSEDSTGVLLAPPGRSAQDILDGSASSITMDWADQNERIAFVLRSGSSPDLDRYRQLALQLVVVSDAESEMSLRLDCD